MKDQINTNLKTSAIRIAIVSKIKNSLELTVWSTIRFEIRREVNLLWDVGPYWPRFFRLSVKNKIDNLQAREN